MQSPKCTSSANSEPCCERNASEETSNNSSKNLRNSSNSSVHCLTIQTSNIAIQDTNGSSPTTPPSPLYKKNLSVDTTVTSASSSSNENPTPSVEETTPSPTTANVRHNVLQKISKWSGLDNFGTPLEPTHIIPLKTPIKTKFLESTKKWRPFTTEDFLFGNLKRLV